MADQLERLIERYQKALVIKPVNAITDKKEQLIAHYEKALIIKYDSSHVHDKLAQIYQSQFKFQEASYHYIKSIQFDPNNLQNYWGLKFSLLAPLSSTLINKK